MSSQITPEQLQDLQDMIPPHLNIMLETNTKTPQRLPRSGKNSRTIRINLFKQFNTHNTTEYWEMYMRPSLHGRTRGRIADEYDWYDIVSEDICIPVDADGVLPITNPEPEKSIIVYIPDATNMDWCAAFNRWVTDFVNLSSGSHPDHEWYEIAPDTPWAKRDDI